MDHYAEIKKLVNKLNGPKELSEREDRRLFKLLVSEGKLIASCHIESAKVDYDQGLLDLSGIANSIEDVYDTIISICAEFGIDITNPYILEAIMDGRDVEANAWAKKEFGLDDWYDIGFRK